MDFENSDHRPLTSLYTARLRFAYILDAREQIAAEGVVMMVRPSDVDAGTQTCG